MLTGVIADTGKCLDKKGLQINTFVLKKENYLHVYPQKNNVIQTNFSFSVDVWTGQLHFSYLVLSVNRYSFPKDWVENTLKNFYPANETALVTVLRSDF